MIALMYGDFFDPPKGAPVPSKSKDKGKGKKGKGVKFAKEAEPQLDASMDVMGRVKGDLFDSDDEEVEEKSESRSRFS
jgi:U3 small nucleolar RNA-associated protein MPP10